MDNMFEGTFRHPVWGNITIKRNPRARNIIMRAREDAIYVTAPTQATKEDIEKALDQCGKRLQKIQREHKPETIDSKYSIDAPYFKLSIKECNTQKIKVTVSNGIYTLYCHWGTDYSSGKVQQALHKCIKAAMRHRANSILPQRLESLAAKHGFTYSRCTLRDTRSRWGSCTSGGGISLNIHLIVLPERLIDYVLLHELCHTVEMNHSERFWALLDKCTAPERAKEMRKRLREFEARYIKGH